MLLVSEIDGQHYPQNKLALFLIGKNAEKQIVSGSAGIFLFECLHRNKMLCGLSEPGAGYCSQWQKNKIKSQLLFIVHRKGAGHCNQGTAIRW